MNMTGNAKAPRVTTEGLSGNQNQINAGGIEKRFDVFNYAENAKETQVKCNLCNPEPQTKRQSRVSLCPKCEAKNDETKTTFLDNFRRHRKVVKLDCFCFAYSTPKTAAMMSKVLPICRACASEVQAKGATAKSNFISRTLNNFHKKLREAAV